jgi:hypothetical protein
MSSAPTLSPAPTDSPPDIIPYASPPTARSRITFRGAVTTLVVGAVFLLLSVALLYIAWSIFGNYAQVNAYRGDALLGLGVFVCCLAGLSFLVGLITVFVGLRGVRQRELA